MLVPKCPLKISNMPVIIFIILHVGELPVTIDFARFDHNSGSHNVTIIANSTLGETDDFTHTFIVQGQL